MFGIKKEDGVVLERKGTRCRYKPERFQEIDFSISVFRKSSKKT